MADELIALRERLATLEERMNTKHQEYLTDIAKLDKTIAQRDFRLLLGVVAIAGVAIAVFKYL